MSSLSGKTAVAKFPLRLMPSVRRTAEAFSQKEGVSLNQFINVAVAEKLAHLQHEEWVSKRHVATKASIEEAIALLDQNSDRPVEEGDELPDEYTPASGEQR